MATHSAIRVVFASAQDATRASRLEVGAALGGVACIVHRASQAGEEAQQNVNGRIDSLAARGHRLNPAARAFEKCPTLTIDPETTRARRGPRRLCPRMSPYKRDTHGPEVAPECVLCYVSLQPVSLRCFGSHANGARLVRWGRESCKTYSAALKSLI